MSRSVFVSVGVRLGVYSLFFACILLVGRDFLVRLVAFHPSSGGLSAGQLQEYGFSRFFFQTSRGDSVEYLYSKSGDGPVVVYFHGNAGTISDRIEDLSRFANSGFSVVGAGYAGYGKSGGRVSRENLEKDAATLIAHVHDSLGYSYECMILVGRSLGSVPVAQLLTQNRYGGAILITPLSSGKAYAKSLLPWPFYLLAGDVLAVADRVAQSTTPLMVIHGTEDEVLPYAMGKEVYEGASQPKYFVEIIGGRHNTLQYDGGALFWDRIDSFLDSYPRCTASSFE
ncbi:alpha/beta hydrolase [Chitinivibrio alkaliphilus]|uniref:Alpha/beta hydrolase family protein n=1 Tax=Chitinivibrio alkaliphilus ACht1 TaxID=1313304 RepID=U7D2D3_9BACT|nr:alpha/beta hydrolase [Chitinivibrio alkaliphilus]ERP30664.1 Alpha/beta hydrolase family protein [Chitinivibrio alkaliphilus ACht1]